MGEFGAGTSGTAGLLHLVADSENLRASDEHCTPESDETGDVVETVPYALERTQAVMQHSVLFATEDAAISTGEARKLGAFAREVAKAFLDQTAG